MELNELLSQRLSTRDYETKIDQILKDIAKLDQDTVANLSTIQKKVKVLKELLEKSEPNKSDNDQVTNWLESYQPKLIKIEQEVKKKSFANELAKELKSLDMSLEGQYPNLKAGFFSLQLDFTKDILKLWYGYEQELLGEYRILGNAKEVKKQIESFLKNGGSGLEPEAFIDKLKKAYQFLLQHKNEHNNQGIPIIQVWLRMASWEIQSDQFQQEPLTKNMKDYSRADFSYDLYKSQKIASQKGLHLTVAVKAYTQNRQDYLWIPSNDRGDGSVFSFIKFEEKEDTQSSTPETTKQLKPITKNQEETKK